MSAPEYYDQFMKRRTVTSLLGAAYVRIPIGCMGLLACLQYHCMHNNSSSFPCVFTPCPGSSCPRTARTGCGTRSRCSTPSGRIHRPSSRCVRRGGAIQRYPNKSSDPTNAHIPRTAVPERWAGPFVPLQGAPRHAGRAGGGAAIPGAHRQVTVSCGGIQRLHEVCLDFGSTD